MPGISAPLSAWLLLALRTIMAVALYAFLALALWTLWKTLKGQARRVTSPQAPPLTLRFPGSDPEKVLSFTVPLVQVGRDPASECWLEDPTLSAQHARLSYHHTQWWVEDLGSTNGTFLNGETVGKPVVLTSGDELRLGGVVIEVKL